MTPEIRRARTAFLWVGVVVPLAAIAVSAVVILLWLPEIPDPAAIHWSETGPDGFAPGWMHLVVLGGIAAMISVFAAFARFAHRLPGKGDAHAEPGSERPQWSSTARLLGATNLGLAALISVISLVAVGSQRGLSDAADAPDIGPAVLLGFLLLAVGAVIGWFLQPRTPRSERLDSEGAAPLAATPTERVVWIGTASVARSGLAVLGGAVLLVGALVAVTLATGQGGTWALAILGVACLVVIVSLVVTLSFRVRIGPGGLVVRSLAGWPRVSIPSTDVASARSVEVDPFAEFGGWGVRYGLDGRYGVVLRRGEAIEVTRTDGRRFVVTVDDSRTAAAVLATAARKDS